MHGVGLWHFSAKLQYLWLIQAWFQISLERVRNYKNNKKYFNPLALPFTHTSITKMWHKPTKFYGCIWSGVQTVSMPKPHLPAHLKLVTKVCYKLPRAERLKLGWHTKVQQCLRRDFNKQATEVCIPLNWPVQFDTDPPSSGNNTHWFCLLKTEARGN